MELICLCPDLDDVFFIDVKILKETLLKSYINIYDYYVNTEWLSDCGKELKQQVRTLLKGKKLAEFLNSDIDFVRDINVLHKIFKENV